MRLEDRLQLLRTNEAQRQAFFLAVAARNKLAASKSASSTVALDPIRQQIQCQVMPTLEEERARMAAQLRGTVEGNKAAAKLMSKQARHLMLAANANKLHNMEAHTRARRMELEQTCATNLAAKRRRYELRVLARKERCERLERAINWLAMVAAIKPMFYVALAVDRAHRRRVALKAAALIQRTLQVHIRILFRHRVRRAFGPRGKIFAAQARAHRLARNTHATDVIAALLRSVSKQQGHTGGWMRMARACVKVSAFRRRIIRLQRWWRRHMVQLHAVVVLTLRHWDDVLIAERCSTLLESHPPDSALVTTLVTPSVTPLRSGTRSNGTPSGLWATSSDQPLAGHQVKNQSQAQGGHDRLSAMEWGTWNNTVNNTVSGGGRRHAPNRCGTWQHMAAPLSHKATAMFVTTAALKAPAINMSNTPTTLATSPRGFAVMEAPMEVRERVLRAFLKARRVMHARAMEEYLAAAGIHARLQEKRRTLRKKSVHSLTDVVRRAKHTVAVQPTPATLTQPARLHSPRFVRPVYRMFLSHSELLAVVGAARRYMWLLSEFWDPRQPTRDASGNEIQMTTPERVGWDGYCSHLQAEKAKDAHEQSLADTIYS
ncbi:hypothetical protein JKP88DRAFT_254882 [Tribonema minus]|uniref:Uncharacterized protein n=1 Tax=Tribonema minus TaxID=303371 RepID=A0A835Z5V6_9STRA|nr:hypothetical protein JKP88DRAFT_254882 [Tribonema minus]